MSVVPQEWVDMVTNLADAQVSRDVMKSPTADQADRDLATARYVLAADAVITKLAALRGTLVLGRITQFLARMERK